MDQPTRPRWLPTVTTATLVELLEQLYELRGTDVDTEAQGNRLDRARVHIAAAIGYAVAGEPDAASGTLMTGVCLADGLVELPAGLVDDTGLVFVDVVPPDGRDMLRRDVQLCRLRRRIAAMGAARDRGDEYTAETLAEELGSLVANDH